MSVAQRLATLEDLARADYEGRPCEIIAGELVEKAAPDAPHGNAAAAITSGIYGDYNRRGGSRHPGGWWLGAEIDILFAADTVLRPDLSGWRRDRVAVMPTEWPVPVTPDWVCEILSPGSTRRDLTIKPPIYHAAHVGHYWVVDRANRMLLVYRHSKDGYVLVLAAGETDTVRAEPFDAVELFVGRIFGVDPPEDE